MIVVVAFVFVVFRVYKAAEEEECMRDLVWFLCFIKNSKRVRRDCGLVIRSRGRWGKCG
uniref:Uncharacterized protein n=1 Tax=Nelumbo nucifera TaxID=4432 RepID=A0A822Z2D9_NELNU|nr:TPA_asm: hypothetical protein HUJ06_008270 [Nelumbo nucifera]